MNARRDDVMEFVVRGDITLRFYLTRYLRSKWESLWRNAKMLVVHRRERHMSKRWPV